MKFEPKAPQDKNAPSWARWKCQDADGTWHWFENFPRYSKKLGVWVHMRGECQECMSNMEINGHKEIKTNEQPD